MSQEEIDQIMRGLNALPPGEQHEAVLQLISTACSVASSEEIRELKAQITRELPLDVKIVQDVLDVMEGEGYHVVWAIGAIGFLPILYAHIEYTE